MLLMTHKVGQELDKSRIYQVDSIIFESTIYKYPMSNFPMHIINSHQNHINEEKNSDIVKKYQANSMQIRHNESKINIIKNIILSANRVENIFLLFTGFTLKNLATLIFNSKLLTKTIDDQRRIFINNPINFLKNKFNKKESLQLNSIISSSYDINSSLDFSNYNDCCIFRIIVPSKFPFLSIENNYLSRKLEKEVLLPPNINFNILEIKEYLKKDLFKEQMDPLSKKMFIITIIPTVESCKQFNAVIDTCKIHSQRSHSIGGKKKLCKCGTRLIKNRRKCAKCRK